jgi:hypothetical protein
MACPYANTTWREVRANEVSDATLKRLLEESDKLHDGFGDRLIIEDNVYTVNEMHNLCVDYQPDIVFIDQLPDIQWHNPHEEELIWFGKACKHIRQYIAKNLRCAVVLVHQLNRSVEQRKDKRPKLSDLRMSGEIEQRSDVVWMGYRDDYYDENPSTGSHVPFELWVMKNRQGISKVRSVLNYNLENQWFETINTQMGYEYERY